MKHTLLIYRQQTTEQMHAEYEDVQLEHFASDKSPRTCTSRAGTMIYKLWSLLKVYFTRLV